MLNDKQIFELKKEYAKLIANALNFKKGSVVYINFAPIEEKDFVIDVVNELYKNGAKKVILEWTSFALRHVHYSHQSANTLKEILKYEIEKFKYIRNSLVVCLAIYTEPFDLLKDISLDKINSINSKSSVLGKYYSHLLNSEAPWANVCVPSIKWAHKLFPEIKDDKIALNKTWELFFKICRVEKNKTIQNWKNHCNDLKERCKYLNSLHIKELHYTSKNGTNLKIGLIKNNNFVGGYSRDIHTKKEFICNIPTEEIFTVPSKYKVNGIVYSTKPLVILGKAIEDFHLVFKNGKIVEVHAKKNEQLLNDLINTDKGSCYLGECALVPYNSPISLTNKIFYSTLIDENSSCHLAFGFSIPFTYPNHEKIGMKKLEKLGFNVSKTHKDFMIGNKDLNIFATTFSGKKIQIFKNGNWAF